MQRLVFYILSMGLAFGPSAGARANDSTAEYEFGALRFTKDPDIAMRSEDLSISMKQVHIVYHFFNGSGSDKTVMVAFPMPDIVGADSDEDAAIPTENLDNLFDFKVVADGVPVALHLTQTAIANGVDQTARLRKMHIPLMPLAKRTNDILDRLPKDVRASFIKLGLGRIETYGYGGPMEDHLVANWTLRSAYTWTQTFPAMRDIKLEQTYQPSVGGSAQTFIGSEDWRKLPEATTYLQKFCIDQDLIHSVEHTMAAKKLTYPPFGEQRIAYVLKTGANWAAPIGDFHLTVDKGASNNLVSFCADGVKKIGPTMFEVRKKDFKPVQDLYILILTPLG